MRRHLLLTLLAAVAWACSPPPPPIAVEEGTITILNQTNREWRNVRIVVNDHFNGGAPVLAAGGRLNAPLSQFQTGYGQKFDRGRQSVKKIEVTATDEDGTAVVLRWPEVAAEGAR